MVICSWVKKWEQSTQPLQWWHSCCHQPLDATTFWTPTAASFQKLTATAFGWCLLDCHFFVVASVALPQKQKIKSTWQQWCMVTHVLPGEKWSCHHKTLLPVDHFYFLMMMQHGHQCCWRHGIATTETPPPMLQADYFKIVFDVMMWQGHNATGGVALLPQKYHHQCHRLIVAKLFLTCQRATTRETLLPMVQVDFLFFNVVLNGVKMPPMNTFTNAAS